MSKNQRPAGAPPTHTDPVRPEAHLETQFVKAMGLAFPGFAPNTFKQQTRLTVRLGHTEDELDGAAAWSANGRADVIVLHNDRAVAVLELKREDLELTDADRKQGLSYCRALTPQPPLVVVSNGRDVQLFDSHTGEAWQPGDWTEEAVAKLFENAAKVAAADMTWAVEALMGPESGVWSRIVRGRTAALIAQLTSAPGAGGAPFAGDFVYPREAAAALGEALRGTPRMVLVEGPPQVGKTGVLRELAVGTSTGEDFAVLMLRPGGQGLFRRIANLFSAELEWQVSPEEVRNWLRRMSHASRGPALVLAIDGLTPGSAAAQDLEELAEMVLGSRLKVVATTFDAAPFLQTSGGSGPTAIAGSAARVPVGPLSLNEFVGAQRVLETYGAEFLPGASLSEEFRAPWVLRSIYDDLARDPHFGKGTHAARLMPSLGLHLVEATSRVFRDHNTLLRGYRLLARDALADGTPTSHELALTASHAFVIREDALSSTARNELADLERNGWIARFRHAGGEDIIAPTLPAVFLLELGEAAADELARTVPKDAEAAAGWLAGRLDAIYLGDLVGAHALRRFTEKAGGLPSVFLQALLAIEPREEPLNDTLFAFADASGELIHVRIKDGAMQFVDPYGEPLGPSQPLDGEGAGFVYADRTAWMMLAQLARLPLAVVGDHRQRFDAIILLKIGQCRFPLLRPNPDGLGHLEHDLGPVGRLLCADQGPIEPATHAIADLLQRPWEHAEAWIAAALDTASPALGQRLLIALRTIRDRAPAERAEWAQRMLTDEVEPTLRAIIDAALELANEQDAQAAE